LSLPVNDAHKEAPDFFLQGLEEKKKKKRGHIHRVHPRRSQAFSAFGTEEKGNESPLLPKRGGHHAAKSHPKERKKGENFAISLLRFWR